MTRASRNSSRCYLSSSLPPCLPPPKSNTNSRKPQPSAMRSTSLIIPLPILLSFALLAVSYAQERKNYVVHLEPRDDDGAAAADSLEDWHRSFLPEATTALGSAGDGGGGPRIIHSYSHVLTGFAARLTDEEAESLRNTEGCLRLYPEEFLPLATTHSPGFLGLHLGKNGFWGRSGFGRGVVIGLLDTGILPSHPSFGDAGLPPPPKKWKGACEFKSIAAAGCNNKVIGARAFGSAAINNTAPPVDDAGHGTHTASTAAGNFVQNADVRGNAHGTASGMAPHAHLAIYKVCTRSRCSIMDIIAGLDAAVKDGVDVLSFSISATDGAQFNYDLIAIATFKAMEHGIFVSAAAGNAGPVAGSITNGAPWMLTVAAGTMDREIRTTVRLGNGQEFDGESLFQPRNNTAGRLLPLVFPGRNGDPEARDCSSLVEAEVSGKVVLCESGAITEHVEQGQTVSAYGGAGMILMNKAAEGYTTFADAHVLPASHVSHAAGSKIAAYIKSTPRPTATIDFRGTVMGSSPSPSVAFFSSRGPNRASPGILKPDITGPGMNILAAWAPSEMHPEFADDVSLTFFMESGTSMSTPHLSGIAAIIKSLHPTWSPAAIKSAIMTSSNTADHAGVAIKDEQYRRASFYAMGAGYVNPSRAVDPGLVYDLHTNDYIAYLCGLGIGDDGLKEITGRRVACAKMKALTEAELNYPSLVVKLLSQPITVHRTVTNVGKASSVYAAVVDMPKEVSVVVRPQMLRFSRVNERQSFTVTVRWNGQPAVAGAEGNLKWVSSDSEHVVRSPVVIPPAKAVA